MKKLVFFIIILLLTTNVYAFSIRDKISSFSIKDTLSSFSVKDFFTRLFHNDINNRDLEKAREPVTDTSTEDITEPIQIVEPVQEPALDTILEDTEEAIQEFPEETEQAGIITQEPIIIEQEISDEESEIIIEQELDLDEEIIPVQKAPGGQVIYPNTKNMNLYSNKNVFLISDTNWKDVLPLVPVTTWTDEGVIYKYPTLVYHQDMTYGGGNVALGREVSASSTYSPQYWQPESLVDGDLYTSWKSGQNNPNEWVLLDLEGGYTINEVKLFPGFNIPNQLYVGQIDILVSNDGINFNAVVENYLVNNEEEINIRFVEVQAQYVKIIFHDYTYNPNQNYLMFVEIEVYTEDTIIYSSFDADSTIHFIQLYEPDVVTVIGEISQELQDLLIADFDPVTKAGGAGLTEEQLESIEPYEYINYWKYYDDIVWVEDNYQLDLLASTYASLRNAPLIIGDTNLDIFNNKNVILVGNLICPQQARSCENFETIEELQHEYIEKTNTDKLLLTNPNDISSDIIQVYPYLEKSGGPITSLYGKHSLIAPILASGKHELIILDDHIESQNPPQRFPNWETTNQLVEDYMENFFDNDAEYLTILASPSMIAHSDSYDNEVDLYYATKPDTSGEDFFLAPGRIYSVTSSDVSSYIARSLFYDELIENIYNEDEYTAFTIGRETYGTSHADAMRDIRDYLEANGYDVEQTLCSSYYANGCENVGTYLISPEEQALFGNKQLVQFSNHAAQYTWFNALDSSMIP